MKNRYFAAFLAVLILGCGGSSRQAGNASVETVAWQKIEAGALLIDVRTPEEYAAGHLEGAINIPYDQITRRNGELGNELDRSIVLYCRTGRRSGIAQRSLEELGFKNLFNAGSYEAMKKARE